MTICCGRGNNGGDGLVVARHLDIDGVPVRVLLFARPEDVTGDAAINLGILMHSGFPVEAIDPHTQDDAWLRRELRTAEWIVDALFGSGLQGPLRPPFDRVVNAINDSPGRVLAVDIPSGLDCDTGQPMGPTVPRNTPPPSSLPRRASLSPRHNPGWGWCMSSAWVCRVGGKERRHDGGTGGYRRQPHAPAL